MNAENLLTPRQSEILDFIRQSLVDSGAPPTRDEIARAFGFRSLNAAEQHLQALQKKGLIELVAGTSRGIRLKETVLALKEAAAEFGLHVVHPGIQDDAHNRTRFAIVAMPDRQAAPRPSGRDCTSLVVSVPNRPGAVHDMLVPLKSHGVSMTRFESRPARSGQWEYYFYIDVAGHAEDPPVATALAELRQVCAFFRLLGSYPADAAA